MMKNTLTGAAVTAAVLAAMPTLAHTGAGPTAGFMAGVTHPLLGADHLLAMVTVGLWAGLMGGRALWMVPAGFVAALLLGGVLGMEGLALPAVELGIAVSVIAFGLLLAFNPPLPVTAAVAAAAVFGLFHGHAHGTEMPADAAGAAYALGFAVATAALHGAGVAGMAALRRGVMPRLVRLLGGAVSGIGLALLAAG